MLAAGAKCVDRIAELAVLGRKTGTRTQAPAFATERADLIMADRNMSVLDVLNEDNPRSYVTGMVDEIAAAKVV